MRSRTVVGATLGVLIALVSVGPAVGWHSHPTPQGPALAVRSDSEYLYAWARNGQNRVYVDLFQGVSSTSGIANDTGTPRPLIDAHSEVSYVYVDMRLCQDGSCTRLVGWTGMKGFYAYMYRSETGRVYMVDGWLRNRSFRIWLTGEQERTVGGNQYHRIHPAPGELDAYAYAGVAATQKLGFGYAHHHAGGMFNAKSEFGQYGRIREAAVSAGNPATYAGCGTFTDAAFTWPPTERC